MSSASGMPRKAILVLSASQYLSGRAISETIKADWSKPKAQQVAHKFDTVGFAVDPSSSNMPKTLESLQQTLSRRLWDGVIVGMCIRGRPEFTSQFEQLVQLLFKQQQQQTDKKGVTKIMFCKGPEDLVETTVRNFPE